MKRILPCILIGIFLAILPSCEEVKARKKKRAEAGDGFYSDQSKYKSFARRTIDSFEELFDKNFNGTVLIYRKGYLYTKAYGYRDVNRKQRMKTDDVFQLASASKPLTAVSVLLLEQDKKIDIDSPVCKYLSDFPYTDITIRQLLNHRSGLANYLYYTDTFWKAPLKAMNNDDFYKFMVCCRPKSYLPPDFSFGYCNTNFALLAVLVAKVSGKAFHEFVEERIFRPAGMRSSFFYGHKPERIKNAVMTGRYDHYEYTDVYPPDGVLGDKSMFSTVNDLFMLHKALSDGRLLSKELLAEMQEPSFGPNVFGGSYGLGFRLMETSNGRWTYHNGWWRGFWTSFWNRFDHETCFVILTNNKKSSHVDKNALAEMLGKAW